MVWNICPSLALVGTGAVNLVSEDPTRVDAATKASRTCSMKGGENRHHPPHQDWRRQPSSFGPQNFDVMSFGRESRHQRSDAGASFNTGTIGGGVGLTMLLHNAKPFAFRTGGVLSPPRFHKVDTILVGTTGVLLEDPAQVPSSSLLDFHFHLPFSWTIR
jgi:hypothetical protein